jgi:hypothetical protein
MAPRGPGRSLAGQEIDGRPRVPIVVSLPWCGKVKSRGHSLPRQVVPDHDVGRSGATTPFYNELCRIPVTSGIKGSRGATVRSAVPRAPWATGREPVRPAPRHHRCTLTSTTGRLGRGAHADSRRWRRRALRGAREAPVHTAVRLPGPGKRDMPLADQRVSQIFDRDEFGTDGCAVRRMAGVRHASLRSVEHHRRRRRRLRL